jgi:4-diphosphocytidyl-2-C-methyl-D-erythritol kinase
VSAWSRDYPAPAKLNLFLHVVGRRADGYHLLQTAFRLLDLADTLRFAPRADGRITRINPLAGVADDDDLTVRAARLLQRESGCRQGVEIALDKRLPMGGGLGGGSSDAATVLLALNRLWQINWPRARLQALGLQLGADVPFFIFGRNAMAEGVGEKLQATQMPPSWYLVIAPPVSVPTREIFAAPELTRNTKSIKMADFSAGWARIAGTDIGQNDLQAVVCGRYPEVAQAIAWLGGFAGARMTGSGACVFAPFATEQEAQDVLARIPGVWRGWVARGLDEHPLRHLAD